MLAYVFWHAAPGSSATAEYERRLLHFGDTLAKAGVPGLLGNASYAIGQTPWLGEPGYEDWAWLEGSWALDGLNERAVSGEVHQPHHAIAQMTKHGGFGALYYPVAGQPDIAADSKASDSKALWLSRPRGINWRDVMPAIVKSANSTVLICRRQMVLGPSPEFAVIGPPTLTLTVPDGWTSIEVQRRKLGRSAPTG